MYVYSFDDTPVGGYQTHREDYQLINDSLRLLAERIESWNATAIKHGALSAPYVKEVEDLRRMVQWGDTQLSNPNAMQIGERGVSVGSFGYIKAALLYAANENERELANTVNQSWPSAVLQAMRGKVNRLRELADAISHPAAAILNEIHPITSDGETQVTSTVRWDVFISHASEDKQDIAYPLAEGLRHRGVSVWYDDFALTVGDSLRRSIDRGLAHSRFGIVILSQRFFEKEWPQKELDGLVGREVDGMKVILPVWHGVSATEIRRFSPTLADRVAVTSSVGLDKVIEALLKAIKQYLISDNVQRAR